MSIKERINAFRQVLKANRLDAWIIPGSDPHMGEYTPDYWLEREFMSGFTGSAGKVVITLNKAALWTDGRYYLQAEDELQGTDILLMKDRLPETISIEEWLKLELSAGSTVGMNAHLFSHDDFNKLNNCFSECNITLNPTDDLLENVWKNRPQLPHSQLFALPNSSSGESILSKVEKVRTWMLEHSGDYQIFSSLDEIAWLFNFRGADISFNPVGLSYALIGKNKSWLFTSPDRVTEELKTALDEAEVTLLPYNEIFELLREIDEESTVLFDGSKTNIALLNMLPESAYAKEVAVNSVAMLKACKNSVELDGFRNSMKRDGVALTRFFMWLENNIATQFLSEYSIAQKLTEFRADQKNYFCDSFGTIAGYNSNGAIIHYSATKERASQLQPEGILLIDSGGQYLDGTTDITRTIALGNVSEQSKIDFTLVLKGHIQLANCKFPKGTTGVQLDILARQFLWQNGLDYNHGTGHGVGHFLNVHEGPQTIRKEGNSTPLQEGMVLSNEPGLYRTGEYGIRIENMMTIIKAETTDFNSFMAFETLTLFPIDTNLIIPHLLSNDEIEWLNSYHQNVFKTLSPLLQPNEVLWLKEKTKSI